MEEWLSQEDGEATKQELMDEAIVAMLWTPSQTAEQESEGEKEEKQRHTWKHVQDCLATFLEFTQSSPYYNSSEVMAIQVIYNLFLSKKASSCKQADICQLFARAAQRSADVPVLDVDDPSSMPSSSGASCSRDCDSSPKPSSSGVSHTLLYSSDSEMSD